MAGGDHDEATLRRYAEAQARLEHAGGYAWRDRAAATLRGLGFAERDLDRPLTTFSGGELTRASLARALAGDPDLLLLDEPTNHLDVENLEWLEQELQSLDAAVILVAHDRWFLEAVDDRRARARGGPLDFLPGPVARVAAREGGAGRPRGRRRPRASAEDIVRLERFVERFRYKKNKAKQAQAKLTQIERLEKEQRRRARRARAAHAARAARLGFDFLKPAAQRPDGASRPSGLGVAAGDKHLLTDATFAIERGEHVGLVGAERLRQDDAARDRARPPRARRRLGAPRPRRRARVLLAARGRARRARQRARLRPARDRPPAPAGAEPARPLPLLRLGGAREAGHCALGRRAAAARARAGRRLGRELPRARRADEPPRPRKPRGARGRARRLPRHRAARLARPRAARRGRPPDCSRSRTASCAPTTAAGPSTPSTAPSRRRSSPLPEPAPKEKPRQAARARAAARASSSSSRPRSRARRRRSPSSSGGSPTTGRTSTLWPRTARLARSYST